MQVHYVEFTTKYYQKVIALWEIGVISKELQ